MCVRLRLKVQCNINSVWVFGCVGALLVSTLAACGCVGVHVLGCVGVWVCMCWGV
jgi:hypothetical protein